MTVLYVERHFVDPVHRTFYESDLAGLLQSMREAPGFLWMDAGASLADAEAVTLASEWRTPEDLEAFLAGAGYASFSGTLDVRLREAPTRRRFVTPG